MAAYSFLDFNFTLAGPTGKVNLGAGASVAEEGVTFEAVEDKNVMTIGADGKGQHSLIASEAATITVRLLKTAPANATLMLMFEAQSVSSALWGQNVMTGVDSARNDITVAQSVAFKKKPTLTYAKEAGFMEWTFDAIAMNSILGGGNPLGAGI